MFNLVKDDFDENMDDIMNSINKMLENDVENEKTEDTKKEGRVVYGKFKINSCRRCSRRW